MKTRRTPSLIQTASWLLCLVATLCLFASAVLAQDSGQEQAPKRGFHPAESYALSDIESISLTGGNLSFNVPLGTVPGGRGGLSAKMHLLYSSKLYDSYPNWVTYTQSAKTNVLQQNLLTVSGEGGWRYGTSYNLQGFDRMGQYTGICCLPPDTPNPTPLCNTSTGDIDQRAWRRFKSKVVFPDGSAHDLIPAAGDDYLDDGYYDTDVFGFTAGCNGYLFHATSGSRTFYTVDGT